jgi:hypothetical protein
MLDVGTICGQKSSCCTESCKHGKLKTVEFDMHEEHTLVVGAFRQCVVARLEVGLSTISGVSS